MLELIFTLKILSCLRFLKESDQDCYFEDKTERTLATLEAIGFLEEANWLRKLSKEVSIME